MATEETMQILEMISAGAISAEQGTGLIRALEGEPEGVDDRSAAPGDDEPNPAGIDLRPPSGFARWKAFWMFPLSFGVGLAAFGGLLVFSGGQAGWHWFWMAWIWLGLIIGVLVILFSVAARSARWLHLRVDTGQDEWPRRIAISLPLPLRTAAWLMRIFGSRIPGLDDVPIPIHEAILALQDSVNPNEPIYVHVEDSGGERVEIYIG